MRMTILLVFSGLLLTGIANSESPGDTDVAFEEILVGDFGVRYDGPTDLVIRNERQWCDFWEKAHAIRTEPPPCDLSLVDFRREAVIATAVAGSNGCVRTDITHIETRRGHRARGGRRGGLRVFVRDAFPGRNCLCTLSFVFPVQAVVVSKPVGRVRFMHETATLQCEGFDISL